MTEDFGQAVALVCKGYELFYMRVKRDKRVLFTFTPGAQLHQTAEDYWNGKLLVDAKRYWNESKNLKTRMYGMFGDGK